MSKNFDNALETLSRVFGPECDVLIPLVPLGSLDEGHEWQLANDPSTDKLTWVPLPVRIEPVTPTGTQKSDKHLKGIEVLPGEFSSDQMLELSSATKLNGTWVRNPKGNSNNHWHLVRLALK